MKGGTYKRYLLVVLLILLALNGVDRLALALLLQDIKVELRVSDTQLGLLTGIAFAFFYTVMGIPIARWADRGNRVTIISITAALWSAAVVACGMAANFLQLLLIRIGVAVGEAGCIPPAHSLIAEYFTRAERPRAVALYMLGPPLSAVIGYFVAGWLNEFYGWRATFMVLGLPGLALALVARLTLREPRLEKLHPNVEGPLVTGAVLQPSVKEVCRTLWTNRTFRHLLFCFSIMSFFGNGIALWQPAFFSRSYGLQSGELGTWFTLLFGMGGALGTYCGGELASRFAAREESTQLKAMAIVYCVFAALSVVVYLSTNRYVAFALMGVAIVGSMTAIGPLFATLQTLVSDRMRAMSIALVYLFANLIGLGLGPLAAGALSDLYQPWAGAESLRYALVTLSPGYLWGAWHFWQASRTVASDLDHADVEGSHVARSYG